MANTYSLDLERGSSQDAYINDASQTGLGLTTDFSFEAWINLESLPSDYTGVFEIIDKTQETSDQRGYRFYIFEEKLYVYYSKDGTGDVTIARTTSAIFDSDDVGVWRHVAVTVDISDTSTGVKFYLDSVSQNVTYDFTDATTLFDSSAPFIVGSYKSSNHYFDGLIDEVRVWSDIRTPTEISDNYDSELVGNESGLVGYWKFNNDYTDETANGNDLTANNAPVFSSSVPFSLSGTTTSTSSSTSTSTTTTSTSSTTTSTSTTTTSTSTTTTSTSTTTTSTSTSTTTTSTSTTISTTTSTPTSTTTTSTSTTTISTSTTTSTSSSTSTTTTMPLTFYIDNPGL